MFKKLTTSFLILAFLFGVFGSPVLAGERIKLERYGFHLDPSCVLYLDFTKYGANTAKIWDQSGQNNHGTITGATPASYPILSGVEKTTNGTFTGSATGWTLGGAWAYNANAVDKNADGITTLSQTDPITSGIRYRLLYKVSNWTVGTVTPSIGGFAGTARGADGYYEEIFIASSTADLVFTPTNTARFTIDTVSVQEVVGYEGLGWRFDGTDDSIVLTSPQTGLGELSAMVWVKFYCAYVDDAAVIQNIIGNEQDEIMSNFTMYDATFRVHDGVAWRSTTTTIVPYHWYCLGMSFTGGTKTLSLYVNGIQEYTSDGLGTFTTAGYSYIGQSGLGSRWTRGSIGEVPIFNRALSAQEHRNYFELTRHRYGMDARDILIKYAEEFEYAMAA